MQYQRMLIEVESPEQMGYHTIQYNLSESSLTDQLTNNLPNINLQNLLLCYGDHMGKPELRSLIAQQSNLNNENQVLVTAGAASALFMVSTALLTPQSHLIVMMPNYATNIETPRAIGCQISFLNLQIQQNFALDIQALENSIQPNTRLISLTTPHNPTGQTLTIEQLTQIIQIAEKHNCYLLIDETYRDLTLPHTPHALPVAATLHPNVISVSSLSKAYGIPGIRIGWLSTQNPELMHTFLAAKEQICICNSILDEEIAYQILLQKNTFLPPLLQAMHQKYEILKQWLANEPLLNYVLPKGGAVCFPQINAPTLNTAHFYKTLFQKYGTYVGAGRWFEQPDSYLRIGFGYPSVTQLQQGLQNISHAIRESI